MTVLELMRALEDLAVAGKGGYRVDVVTRDGADCGPLRDVEAVNCGPVGSWPYVNLAGAFDFEDIEP